MTASIPICAFCAHLHRGADTITCDAFPQGVPSRILVNKDDHRRPLDGDHGIQFAQDPDLPLLPDIEVAG